MSVGTKEDKNENGNLNAWYSNCPNSSGCRMVLTSNSSEY